jgi:type 1 glutamine amidotransferase
MKLLRTLLACSILSSVAIYAAEPKKVIVCTVTTGFRHSSIPYAEKTLQKLAEESKAFTIVDWVQQPKVSVPNAPSKPKELKADASEKDKAKYAADLEKYEAANREWETSGKEKAAEARKTFEAELRTQMAKLSPENLAKVDGVIFANTTGDLPLPDKDGFIKWIEAGHGFMAMHSGGDTFHNFKPYIDMLGGEFTGHEAQVPAELIVADAEHPAAKGLPNPWKLAQEEMYLFKNHDPKKVRRLLQMKHHPNRAEVVGYHGVSWCKMAGQGRVFYTSLGHREDLWSDEPNLKDRKNPVETSKQYQQHILGGIKWALGLEKGSAEPQPDAP